jgi:hypothetical protein
MGGDDGGNDVIFGFEVVVDVAGRYVGDQSCLRDR